MEPPVKKKKGVLRRKGAVEPETAEKRAEVLRLRRDYGYSNCKIAEIMGLSVMYVGKLFKAAISDIYRSETKEVVELEIAKLDNMYAEAMKVMNSQHLLVNNGQVVSAYVLDEDGEVLLNKHGKPMTVRLIDNGPKLAALDRMLKVSESKRKLLGVDKPTKVAQTSPDGEKAASFVVVASPEDQAL